MYFERECAEGSGLRFRQVRGTDFLRHAGLILALIVVEAVFRTDFNGRQCASQKDADGKFSAAYFIFCKDFFLVLIGGFERACKRFLCVDDRHTHGGAAGAGLDDTWQRYAVRGISFFEKGKIRGRNAVRTEQKL